jgi:[CysO sulfur-carrier protein]-S-L-cysteine hydrolase
VVGLTRLALPGDLWAIMERDIKKQYPEEACGFLAGSISNGLCHALAVIPMENILHSPTRFRLDSQHQLDQLFSIQSQNMELIAIYHSHPLGGAKPSETDQAEVYDPAVISLIWYLAGYKWECRAYTMEAMVIQEIPIDLKG